MNSILKAIKALVVPAGVLFILSVPARTIAQVPTASFSTNTVIGCAPLSVDFTNLSTQADSYLWDFGNGNTSTLTNPTTVYLSTGFYTVTLIAINSFTGNRDTLVSVNYIEVVTNPIADFSAPVLSGCAGTNSISFVNASINATSYIWDFGDGNFSTLQDPVHTYANPGTYTVKLIAANTYNCTNVKTETAYITIHPNPPAAFTVDQQSTCDASHLFSFTATTPGAASWEWDLGDGTTSTLENPTHIYGATGAYTVSLIVTSPNGCVDTLVSNNYINIGATLVPTFTVASQSGCAPFSVTFNCTVPDAISWAWTFGDGNTSNLENPVNIYTTQGTFNIGLTVNTSSGCNGSVTLPSFITVASDPIASFTPAAFAGCIPSDVTFTNSSLNAVSYLWDFGDGTTSTDENPVHNYAATGSYDVTLIAFSPAGCSDTLTMPAAVIMNDVSGSFTCTPLIGCAPLPVTYTGTSTAPGSAFQWFFGDGNTGTGDTGTHFYGATGDYTVTMIVTSSEGCTDTITRVNYIRVVPDSTPYTVPDTMQVCTPPGTVTFTDPTTGSNSWLWDFGNGDSSTLQNPSYAYTTPGIYTVTLTTGMAGGCTQFINPYAYIEVLPFDVTPIINVIVSPCGPFTVQLDNLTLNVASYLWDFGDGNTSTLQNPVHTYAQAGTYTISLLLTAINGCQTSLSTTVTFGHNNPITVSDDDICLGDSITFSLNPAGSFVSASWDFGDGNTSTSMQPVHLYTATGSYNVSVTITDTDGCVFTYNYTAPVLISDPQPSFVVGQALTGCTPFPVQFTNTSTGASSYSWDFGNGTSSTLQDPVATYTLAGTYSVTLSATENGCTRSVTQPNLITANSALANFSFTPHTGCLPLTVTFTDLSPAAVSWSWNFGDGNTSTLQNPVHTYTTVPTGPITLSIVDTNGCTRARNRNNVNIVIPDITASDTAGCKPLQVNFTTTTNAATYLWDFGDGNTSTLQNPSHLYTQSGSFTVTLSCVLASGCTTTTVRPAMITIDSPTSAFTTPTLIVCAPSLVNFTNQSTGALSWYWDFGDGTSSTSQHPSHIYNIPGTYTVSLVSTGVNGCTDTLVKPDYITVPGTYSNFSFITLTNCVNTIAVFTDSSINATSWFWNFGDGFTSMQQNPVHTYTDSGSYTVTLITTDSIGCSSFISGPNPVSVYPDPVVNGSLDISEGCAPLTVQFSNQTLGAVSYDWNFGDGVISNDSVPFHTYTTPGTYQPYLVATTNHGCVDTFMLSTPVIVHAVPSAAFTPAVTSGCRPLLVSFANQSTLLSGSTFQWNFGNGATSALQDPTVVYNSTGSFTVTMIITTPGGCRDTVSQVINVYDPPVAAAVMSDSVSCGPMTVNFTNQSQNSDSFIWNFGDGTTSSTTDASHTYNVPGIYVVSLVAANASGCTDTLVLPAVITINEKPSASFVSSTNSGCMPLPVNFSSTSSQLSGATYNWDFGNGSVSTLPSPVHVYNSDGTFDVIFSVENSNGCSDTAFGQVTVHPLPQAIATVNDTSSCGPLTATFANISTGAVGYAWDFGDGTSSTDSTPVHVYGIPGSYQVTLIATSANGCTDTLAMPNLLSVYEIPVAAINASATEGCSPLNVIFTDNSTQLNNPIYSWNPGNGQTGSGNTISGNYTSGGNYEAVLVVTNLGGCSDSATINIIVHDLPVAMATTSDTSGCAPYQVTFTNNSLNSISYFWDFGDGNTSALQSPVHIYTNAGDYTVTLITTGSGNCSDTLILSSPVHVKATPDASFIPSATSGCTPFAVGFNNTSTNLVNAIYQWDLGNGATSTLQDAQVVYMQEDSFIVSLVVINDEGCSDTATAIIVSHITPQAIATISDTVVCVPASISFNSTSLNATSYLWVFGDGSTDTSASGSHIYSQPGVYSPYLVASTAAGCADTLQFTSPVIASPVPVAGFSAVQTAMCSGSQFQMNNLSTPSTGLTYQWNIGGNVYSVPDPSFVLTNPGFYDVTLIVTNQYGCSDTLLEPNYIQVYDTMPPPVSPILSVSVVNNTSVEITWQNSSSLDLGAYVLYRLNDSTGVYDEVYRDNSPVNANMSVASTYTDTGLNTLQKVYTYKLATLDRCSYVLPLSALTPHTTINVTATPVNNNIRVSWTRYLGCNISSYEINRINLNSGASQLIATVPPNTLQYLDVGFVCPDLYSYRITATALCGNTYISNSDTSIAQPANPLASQKVEIVRSTVIDNRDVLTEWLPPSLAPNRVVRYEIFRSENNIDFDFVTSVPVSQLSYVDYNAYVQDQNYYYKIEVISDCEVAGSPSNEGSSILLKGNWDNERTRVWWTDYLFWSTGVDYYVIERLNGYGGWDPVKRVDGNVTDTMLDE